MLFTASLNIILIRLSPHSGRTDMNPRGVGGLEADIAQGHPKRGIISKRNVLSMALKTKSAQES